MIPFNAPIWKKVSSAAGANVDQQLSCIINRTGDFHEDLENLAYDLSHQFDFYDATPYVLPHLSALCATLSLEDKIFLISLIGPAIAAEAYHYAGFHLLPNTEAYWEFEEGLDGLRRETKCVITNPKIAEILGNDPKRQEFALSALSILGDRKHAYGLYIMRDSDWEDGLAACSCGFETEEFAIFDDRDYFNMQPAQIASWDGKTMDNESVWFQGLLKLIGEDEIIHALPWLYGTCTCPDCKKQETYWQWLAQYIR